MSELHAELIEELRQILREGRKPTPRKTKVTKNGKIDVDKSASEAPEEKPDQ